MGQLGRGTAVQRDSWAVEQLGNGTAGFGKMETLRSVGQWDGGTVGTEKVGQRDSWR